MSEPKLSSKQYAENGGGCCPICGSEDITGESINIEGSEAFQEITCNDCEAFWVDRYVLAGYQELKPGGKP